jgi:protease-4
VAKSKNRAVLGVLLMIVFFFIILMIFASYTMKVFKSESITVGLNNKKGEIAVIEIEGPIMKSKHIVELLEKAEKSKDIKAIILRINSPGGAVGPTQEIYEEIRRIDGAYSGKDGDKGKPIYASFGAMSASGGYYIGAATRKIYASSGTLTGSIGVIMNFQDLSELFKFAKVKPQPIKAGRYKDVGSPHRPFSVEEKGMLTDMLAGVHKQFIRDILKVRKSRIKGDINELAQGQIFTGEQAKNFGLVDEIKGLWAAGRAIHKELGLKGEFGLRYVKKKKKASIWELMDNLNETMSHVKSKTLGSMTTAPMFLYSPGK